MSRGGGRRATPTTGWAARSAGLQQRVVLVLAAAIPLVYSSSAASPFSTVKFSALLLGAALLGAFWLADTVATRQVAIPQGRWLALLGLLFTALLIALIPADAPGIAVFGAYRRHAGLLLYSSCLVVLLAVVRHFTMESLRWLAIVLAGTTGAVAIFGLLQLLFESDTFERDLPGLTSTLGNPNFASGALAIGAPLVLWGLLATRRWQPRAGLLLLGLTLVVGILATRSFQGPIAAAAGVWVVALTWAIDRDHPQRRVRVAVLVGLAVVGVAVGVAGLAGVGPLEAIGRQGSVAVRRWYWGAAISMWRDNPILGVGLDNYGTHYLSHRTLEAAKALGLTVTNDAAHSVPIHQLASGGLLLGSVYVAFLGLTGWSIARGLQRLRGAPRLLLGGFAGAWLAYQVQSLVSIDVPPLAFAHFLLAGAVLACTGEVRWRTWSLPGAEAVGSGRRRRNAQRAATAVAAVVALVAGYGASLPFRADLAAGDGRQRLAADETDAALASLERAIALAPWEGRYRFDTADAMVRLERYDAAEAQLRVAEQLNPGSLAPVLSRARLAKQLGRPGKALAAYDRALVVEPTHPDMKLEVARYLLEQGRRPRAIALLTDLLAADPANRPAQRLLEELNG